MPSKLARASLVIVSPTLAACAEGPSNTQRHLKKSPRKESCELCVNEEIPSDSTNEIRALFLYEQPRCWRFSISNALSVYLCNKIRAKSLERKFH